MKNAYDLTGASPFVKDVAVYGAGADILEGAVVIRGATPGTNGGQAIVGTGALTHVIGVLNELHDFSVSGDSLIAGTAWVRRKVIINPMMVYRAQYDTADDMDVASVSGTTVTITSLEDNIDAGWLLFDDGAGAYGTGTTAARLTFLTASASGSATSKDDLSAVLTSANDALKILPVWHQLCKINGAGDKLGTDAAAGTGRVSVIENWIEATGIPLQVLDPTKHSGLQLFNPKIYSDIVFLDHVAKTLA